jgi:hypothetical protein
LTRLYPVCKHHKGVSAGLVLDSVWHTQAVIRRLLVTVVCVLTVALPAAGAVSRPKPTLTFVTTTPLIVKGQHFKARERVRLVLWTSGLSSSRTTRAGVNGSLVTSFGDVDIVIDRCGGEVFVVATGGAGSRAMLGLQPLKLPRPDCPIQP